MQIDEYQLGKLKQSGVSKRVKDGKMKFVIKGSTALE
jgi:hypothetical protein